MNFRPKNYYLPASVQKPQESVGSTVNVYYRKADKSLGQFKLDNCESHKDAILTVKESLVAEGDCLTNKAVLAVIEGGKSEQ